MVDHGADEDVGGALCGFDGAGAIGGIDDHIAVLHDPMVKFQGRIAKIKSRQFHAAPFSSHDAISQPGGDGGAFSRIADGNDPVGAIAACPNDATGSPEHVHHNDRAIH